jgi:hypothetical protein
VYSIVDVKKTVARQPFPLDIRLNPDPDGNCQFTSLSDQLTEQMGITIDHHILRQLVTQYLTKHNKTISFMDYVTQPWSEYMKKMKQPCTYGDHITLTAVAHMFHVQIVVLHSSSSGTFIPCETGKTSYDPAITSLFLGYYDEGNGEHYLSLNPPPLGTDVAAYFSQTQSVQANDSRYMYDSNSPIPEKDSSCSQHVEETSIDDTVEKAGGKKDLPECWSSDQAKYFKNENQWLLIQNGMLGCSVCQSAKNIALLSSQGVRLSPEWMACKISPFGSTKCQQQNALRKKISEHKTSHAHNKAASILSSAEANAITNAIATQQSEHYDATCRIFRTVYNQAKLLRPFTDLQSNIDLQKLNGLNMGRILHSNVSCSNISVHIANEMRKQIVGNIISQNCPVSVLVDESTTLSQKTTLIIYIRTVFPDEIRRPVTLFIDIVELQSTTADIIASTLLKTLETHGMTHEFLTDNLVGFASDGASVMLGRKKGVAKVLLDKFPQIVVWHCAAHRLELSLHDTLTEVAGINSFKCFLDKLYSLYHASPKNRFELRECANELNIQLLSIGRLLDTRWVASSFRTLKAVWQSYSALSAHFLAASTDTDRSTKERASYKGLLLRLTTNEFVLDMAAMLDALQELSELSLELQKRNSTIVDSDRAIRRQIKVFEAMIDNCGRYLSEAQGAITQGFFRGVQLHPAAANIPKLNHKQLFRSLADNMTNRLLVCLSSNPSSEQNSTDNSFLQYTELTECIKVLYHDNWPRDFDIQFGEKEINILCSRFGISVRPAVRAFRVFLESNGAVIEDGLKRVVSAVEAIAISTAECERGFSCMNLTLTSTRNSLNVTTLSCLMFLKLVGPPLNEFNPLSYVRSWLAKGHHAATDTKSAVHKSNEPEADASDMHLLWRCMQH